MDRRYFPSVVSRAEWLVARKALLEQEKALTRQRDALNMARRRLPMVAVEQDYRFQGPLGDVGLLELFAGRSQLIVYHFMYHMVRGEGCDGMPDLDGKGLHWTRLHDEYEQPAAQQDCCAHKA